MRALIVDDEKTPRDLLRHLVPWAALGFDRVDTAKNGLEALGLLEAGDVDVVLTDVRMPKMDGIELAAALRDRWPETVLIFLSGYSDKEYLKSAIRLQAQDYLDKPIELAPVEEALRKAAAQVQKRQSAAGLEPLRKWASAQTLFGLTAGGALDERFQTGHLRVLAVEAGLGITVRPSWGPSVVDLINAEAFLLPAFVAVLVDAQTVAVAADRVLSADGPSFDRAVEELLGRISTIDPGADPRIGVAPACTPDRTAEALALARTALHDSFYRPAQRIYLGRPADPRSFDLPAEAAETWRSLMAARDYPAVLRQLDHLEQRALTLRDPDLDRVRRVWKEAVARLLAFVPAWGPGEREGRLAKLEADLAKAATLAQAADLCRDCFHRLFVQAAGDLHSEDRVKRAQDFMATQFADPDLTVEAVAAHVGFSESYFCTVFKQTTGTTVKDYVTQLRIDRAKAYLWEKSPPTLADLALKVGYRDPNYFSTVFKRLTGTSPGAYRKRALG